MEACDFSTLLHFQETQLLKHSPALYNADLTRFHKLLNPTHKRIHHFVFVFHYLSEVKTFFPGIKAKFLSLTHLAPEVCALYQCFCGDAPFIKASPA